MPSPITYIPFGQPLLITDVAGGVPKNDWELQENENDCRIYDDRVYMPFYVGGADYISLQFIGDITAGYNYKINVVGDSPNVSGYSVAHNPNLIRNINTNNRQFAWYFLSPNDYLPDFACGDACFHLEITKDDVVIAISQSFKIYCNTPDCSINISVDNEDDIFGFIYKKSSIANPIVPDFNITTGWTYTSNWDLTTTPGKALLNSFAASVESVETNGGVSGLVTGNIYKLTVLFNWNEKTAYNFYVGTQLVGKILTTDPQWDIPSSSFTVTYSFIYDGTGQKFKAEALSGLDLISQAYRSNVENASISSNSVDVKQSIRLTALQWKPKYNEDVEIFKDSKSIRHILAATSEPIYELLIDEVPEYVHNFLRLAKLHDVFTVDGIQYDVVSKDYVPEWRNDSKFAQIRIELTKTNGQSIRSNC